jgi:methylphosphotriester-DNA--protein-cysteine methyltransferase
MADDLKKTAGIGDNNGPMSDDEKMNLIRKHVKKLEPLEKATSDAQAAVTKAHRDFKTATGVTRKDFDFGRRLGEIQDEDEQKEKTNAVKLVFNAISQNAQLNFFDIDEGDEKTKKKR